MKDKKLKVSDLIKNTCCGTLLDVPKHKLVKMAQDMESDNNRLKSEIKRLEAEKKRMINLFVFTLAIFGCLFMLVKFWMS